jgi:hypothetical protein
MRCVAYLGLELDEGTRHVATRRVCESNSAADWVRLQLTGRLRFRPKAPWDCFETASLQKRSWPVSSKSVASPSEASRRCCIRLYRLNMVPRTERHFCWWCDWALVLSLCLALIRQRWGFALATTTTSDSTATQLAVALASLCRWGAFAFDLTASSIGATLDVPQLADWFVRWRLVLILLILSSWRG